VKTEVYPLDPVHTISPVESLVENALVCIAVNLLSEPALSSEIKSGVNPNKSVANSNLVFEKLSPTKLKASLRVVKFSENILDESIGVISND
jgi:hypothetical protein